LGGYLTDNFSWRWAFYINLPIGILALFMNFSFVFDPPYQQRWGKGDKVDYLGVTLLCLGLGSIQIVMDKGQQYDWFNSPAILLLFVVAVVSLVVFVFWEITYEQPVLDLSIFKNLSFATGNAVMFVGFFAFFGSIVLLPLFLQGLMGYNAFLAGMVLGPGGAAALVTMPIVGKLTERIDARMLLGFGLLCSAYAVYYMSGFNLHVDVGTIVHARLIQGFSIAFFFVPLSYITMAWVAREQMNNASAIFNLLRNMGGSLGVAFVSTLIARRAQFHQNRIFEHLTPFHPEYAIRLEELKRSLALKLGDFVDNTYLAEGVIYRYLQREAGAMAFNDAFYAQTLLFLGLMLLLWIMRKPPLRGDVLPDGDQS
jgi:DHA2 family multidrug resistance protein